MPSSPVPPPLAAFLSADLPSPLKAIAGIAVAMVHDAKALPERAVQLPTSILTHLATTSLKVQQQYAEWVARGEEFLGALHEPTEDVPEWATFDEDLPADDEEAANLGLGPGSAFDRLDDEPAPVEADDDADRNADVADEPAAPAPVKKAAPAKKSAPAKKTAPAKKAAPLKAAPAKSAEHDKPAKKAAPAKKSAPTAEPNPDAPDAARPQSLPDFDTLTIPQLRTRLKTLRTPELLELVEYEEAARNRPAIVGMLRARLETLQQ